MWRDIALANRRNLTASIDAFIEQLHGLRNVLHRGDGKALQRFFFRAKQRRDQWSKRATSPSPE